MLRLSKLSDYAVVVLIRLGETGSGLRAPDGGEAVCTTGAVAGATGLPEPTVAKVLKALAGAGIVDSRRGARGGYWLARAPAAISLADVIAAIDGPIALTACVGGGGACDIEHVCSVRGRWNVVNTAIDAALRAVSIADLAERPAPNRPVTPPAPSAPAPPTPAHVE